MPDEDEWLRTHQGEYLRTVGRFWWCGDYECDCTQAVIVEYYRNAVVPIAQVPINIWSGPFHTEGEYAATWDELMAKREELRLSDPDLEARIEWEERS